MVVKPCVVLAPVPVTVVRGRVVRGRVVLEHAGDFIM